MALLDEGTECWRPVLAEELGNGLYRLHGSMPDDETWQFQPGDVVRCEWKTFAGGEAGLTAFEKV